MAPGLNYIFDVCDEQDIASIEKTKEIKNGEQVYRFPIKGGKFLRGTRAEIRNQLQHEIIKG